MFALKLPAIFACMLLWIVAGASAQAGVVVFGNGAVLVTLSQAEKDGQLTVKMPSGEATFVMDQIAWYSKDASVDTLWAAAQAAAKEGKSNVAVLLAQEASFREPANAAAAKQMVVQFEARLEEVRKAAAPQSPSEQPAGESGAGGFMKMPGVTGALNQQGITGAAQGGTGTAEEAQSEPAEIGAHGWPVENSAISAEDFRVNAIVAGVFGLVVLFTLWKMTVSDA